MSIKAGMWAIQDIKHWATPMFEVTDDFVKQIDDNFYYDNYYGCTIGSRWFIVADTKDELKNYVLGKLFAQKDYMEKKIQDTKNEIDKIQNIINKVAGE